MMLSFCCHPALPTLPGLLLLLPFCLLWAPDTYWQKTIKQFNGGLYLQGCDGITLSGTGVMDGQGYDWWWQVILSGYDHRPDLISIGETQNIEISLSVRNSPQFHFNLHDVRHVHVHDMRIDVDVDAQRELLQQNGHWDALKGIPTYVPSFFSFPLICCLFCFFFFLLLFCFFSSLLSLPPHNFRLQVDTMQSSMIVNIYLLGLYICVCFGVVRSYYDLFVWCRILGTLQISSQHRWF
jgi:hypothetical protein